MSHKDSKIFLNNGANAILGKNGTGKSSVVLALMFALANLGIRSQQKFVRNGESTAEITVSFFLNDGSHYTIIRSIGKTSTASLLGPTDTITEIKEVYIKLEQLFEVDNLISVFNDLCIRSSTLVAPFELEASKRKAIFDALLKVEIYERMWFDLRKPLALLNSRLNELENTINKLSNDLKEINLPQVTEKLERINNERLLTLETINQKTKEYNLLINQIQLEKQVVEKRRDLDQKISDITTIITSTEQNVEGAQKNSSGLKARLGLIRKNIKALESNALDKCPYCKQELQDKSKTDLLAKFYIELKDIETKLIIADGELDEFFRVHQELKYKLQKLELAREEIQPNFDYVYFEKLLHELSVLKNNLLQKERDILILENSLSTGNFIAETI
jgi:exonuclease SbcC